MIAPDYPERLQQEAEARLVEHHRERRAERLMGIALILFAVGALGLAAFIGRGA